MLSVDVATVFLDRDGTINEKPIEGEYVTSSSALRLLPRAAEAIRRLNDAGAYVVVVTNQRGIALGRMTSDDLLDVHDELMRQLAHEAGAHIDGIFWCPHNIGECECRKPNAGLFVQALTRFPCIDFARSVVIGDSTSDVEAGERLGMATIQLGVTVADLNEAVTLVLESGLIGFLSQRVGTEG